MRSSLVLLAIAAAGCAHESAPLAVALAADSGHVVKRFDDDGTVETHGRLANGDPVSISCVCMKSAPHNFVGVTLKTGKLAEGRVDQRGKVLDVSEGAAAPDVVTALKKSIGADFRKRCTAPAKPGNPDDALVFVHGHGANAKRFSCAALHVNATDAPDDKPVLEVCRALFASTQRTCP